MGQGSCGRWAAWPAGTIAAAAHVKWFCSTADVTLPPIALTRVLTPTFAIVAVVFVALVFGGFVLDRAVALRWPGLASSGRRHAALEERLVRLAVGAYFLLLWDKTAVVLWRTQGGAVLTPELLADLGWVTAVQLAVAVLVGWRGTCVLAGVGIMMLYGYGIARFGVFHMTDYVFFPEIAAYLALTSIGTERALRWRVPLLSGGLAFALMWTAVEKFVYPEWTLAVVATHPELAFGFDWRFVTVVAGLPRVLEVGGARAIASVYVVALTGFFTMYYGLHWAEFG